jgi:hypothetical protein
VRRRLDQTHRSALDDHLHRHAPMEPWVMIHADWYEETCARIGFGFSLSF